MVGIIVLISLAALFVFVIYQLNRPDWDNIEDEINKIISYLESNQKISYRMWYPITRYPKIFINELKKAGLATDVDMNKPLKYQRNIKVWKK